MNCPHSATVVREGVEVCFACSAIIATSPESGEYAEGLQRLLHIVWVQERMFPLGRR